MKNIVVIFFLLFPNIVLSHPLGINDNKVDINFKCIDQNLDRKINFGFKEYTYQKDSSEFLLSVPFDEKSNKYSIPTSGLYEFGTYKIKNEVFDNMQMWFGHGYSGSNTYVFRFALVKQKNVYILNNSFFKSTKLIHNKLENSTLIYLTNENNLKIYSVKKSKFLIIAGEPICEPVARGGPFVMNTKQEILKAIEDYQSGNFVQK